MGKFNQKTGLECKVLVVWNFEGGDKKKWWSLKWEQEKGSINFLEKMLSMPVMIMFF